MAIVTVIGTAQAAVTPDRAVARLTVTHLAPTASEAMAEVARRSDALTGLLDDIGVDRRDWATSGVQVSEESEWRNDRSEVVGQRATSMATVTVRDIRPEVLGRLLRDAVDVVGARVDGLGWLVDDGNPARVELLAEAARDARRRADAYAAALGLVVSAVDEVSEQPFLPPEPRLEGMAMMRAKSAMASDAPLPVNAGDVEIAARVHVRFRTVPA